MKVAVIYISQSGNTEMMAEAIAEGLKAQAVDTSLLLASDFNESQMDDFDRLIFGSPAMGNEVIDEDVMELLFTKIEPKLNGKEIALFGSYGWGNGEFLQTWIERSHKSGAKVLNEGLIINYTPDEDGLEICKQFGIRCAH